MKKKHATTRSVRINGEVVTDGGSINLDEADVRLPDGTRLTEAKARELAEELLDIQAAEAARAEMLATGEAPIPWEQVRADLGRV